ncbi:MAG: D-glucuronyl C5-epimerase family protein [Candidatus Sifarchaeia archaeon]
MRAKDVPRSIFDTMRKRKRTIFRRLLIYLIILAILFPFVFINRTAIYSTILSRYDTWRHWRNSDGFPVTDYGYQAGVYVGEQISMRLVSSNAIAYHEQWKAGNSSAEVFFNNMIDYILEHRKDIQVPTENGSRTITVWPYEFAIWDLPKGWQSAMVDARVLNALALAYQEYGNSSLSTIIDQSIASFETPTYLGGNLLVLEDGTYWYPETVIPNELYPDYPVPLILNGFLFALENMYHANEILNNTSLETVFNKGIISAAANLYRYDLPQYNWTLYHIAYPQKLASNSYHNIHISLTRQLYEWTNVSIFDTYSTKWESYTSRPFFTWEEIFSWEFISNGLLMVSLILIPIVSIDILQVLVRSYMRREAQSS